MKQRGKLYPLNTWEGGHGAASVMDQRGNCIVIQLLSYTDQRRKGGRIALTVVAMTHRAVARKNLGPGVSSRGAVTLVTGHRRFGLRHLDRRGVGGSLLAACQEENQCPCENRCLP